MNAIEKIIALIAIMRSVGTQVNRLQIARCGSATGKANCLKIVNHVSC